MHSAQCRRGREGQCTVQEREGRGRMSSFHSEVQRNFGVRLRSSDVMGSREFGAALVDRVMYLPPDPVERCRMPPDPRERCRMPPDPRERYRGVPDPRDLYTGNWALAQHPLPSSPLNSGSLARLGLLQGPAWGPAVGVRRVQSFSAGM